MRWVVFVILFSGWQAGSLSAQEGFYRNFDALATPSAVDLDWVIRAGNSCVNMYITRSLDGVTFDTVGTIVGLCGDDDEDLYYEFRDTSPVVNRINYYQLQFGNVTRSEVLPVEVIDLQTRPYQLLYDPATNKYQLHFSNPGRDLVVFETYTYSGQRIAQQATNSDRFMWQDEGQIGFRLFVLRKAGQIIASGHLP